MVLYVAARGEEQEGGSGEREPYAFTYLEEGVRSKYKGLN